MRRNVDRRTRDRRASFVRSAARGIALAALLAGWASAGEGDGPELSPPNEMPVVPKPATPAPASSTPKPLVSTPRPSATLTLPGLTTPTPRPSPPVDAPRSGPGSSPGELSLDAPVEMKPLPDALPTNPVGSPSRSNLPLILESSPMDEPAPSSGSTKPSPSQPRKPAPAPQPVPAPARRPRLFGFLAGPTRPTTTTPAPSSRTVTPGRSVAADGFREDPASESALKRRIERQARDAVGNRARSVEVRVEGKEAVVHVSGVKFYQKRAVRKQLEAIPALAGLRSTIEVAD